MSSRTTRGRRSPSLPLSLGLVVLLGCGVAGCAGDPAPAPRKTPAATAAAEPVFASDEEALAAAVEAYGAYLAASNEILNDGGNDPERIREYTTAEYAEEIIQDYTAYAENEVAIHGANSFDSATLSNWGDTEEHTEVQLYVCLDVSSTRVFKHGVDVTPEDRGLRTPLIVSLEGTHSLRVSRSDRWSGHDFCS